MHNFEVPWDKFPSALLEACKSDKEPKPSHRSEMVRVIADEVFKHATKPGSKNLETIAIKIVQEYPKSFKDHIDGLSVGKGHSSLTQQLINRVDNARRSVKRFLTSEATTPKKQQVQTYGCIEWSPPLDDAQETKDKQTCLLQEYAKESPDLCKVTQFMKETYPSQRNDINKPVPIFDVKKHWPFLLRDEFLMLHFNLLTGKMINYSYEDMDANCFKLWK